MEVIECRRHVRLSLKTGQVKLPRVWITGEVPIYDFDGHRAMGVFLTGQKDRPHAADAQEIFQNTETNLGAIEDFRVPTCACHLRTNVRQKASTSGLGARSPTTNAISETWPERYYGKKHVACRYSC